MAIRGIVRPLNRFGVRLPRLVIHDDDTTPVDVPFHLYPTSAPSATAVKGDIYFDSTRNIPLFHSGTSYLPPGGKRTIKTAAATLTARDSGALCVFNSAAGDIYTLPSPEAGLFFDFTVAVTITSNAAKVITNAGTVFLLGSFLQIPDTAAQIASQDANGTTHVAWSGNGSTTGGIKGDFFRVTAISTTQWVIFGIGRATGTEATPFATS